MKRYLTLTILCAVGFALHTTAQLRAFTPRFSRNSVRGNIRYVSNSIISTEGRSTTDAPPSGTVTNNGVGTNIDIDSPPTVFFDYTTVWKYYDIVTAAKQTYLANWKTVGYDDSGWPSGPGQLGYGDGDEGTVVSYGGNASNKRISTYFRKVVNIPDPALFGSFILNVHRDDGIVVYVNGVEVGRDNMPAGTITYTTTTTNAADNGTAVIPITVSPSAFVAGNNTIAVEVHQTSVTSSDLSFDMQLLGTEKNSSVLFDYDAVWKYYDTVTAAKQPYLTNWNTASYNDSGWPSGPGQLGYGDGDEGTVVSYGPSSTNKYISTYFRKVVNISNPGSYASFLMNVHRDDGIVVYVNGVEVARNNMPTGTITYTTTTSNASDNGATVIPLAVSSSAFVPGNNTIAVEVHQTSITSSDLSFDMQLVGLLSGYTFNSSAADLDLLSCSNVLFAGLYWGAGQGSSGSNTSWITGEDTCLLKIPGASSYVKVTSTQTDYHNNTITPGYAHTGFKCFADITSLINASNPNGTYTIANIASPAGITDAYGGWTIVVVYGNNGLPVRNLTVFDGNAIIKSGSPPEDVTISGFLTPPSGAVTCELGAVVYDGDRGSADSFAFKQNGAASFYNLATTSAVPTSGIQDMWNSTIAYMGTVSTARNPAYNNTLGYDANIIDLPNAGNAQLGNNKTSATVRFASPSENYITQVLTTSISQYNPSFSLTKTSADLNGGSLEGGDVLRYTISYNNLGNDASTNSSIVDNIPYNGSIVPGSLKINGVAQTDASGDDQAEYDFVNRKVVFRVGTGADNTNGGAIAISETGQVTFDMVVSSSCSIAACGSTVSNSSRIEYTGQTTGDNLYDSSLHDNGSGCFVPGPVTNTITSNCYTPSDTTLINICPSLSISLPWARYAGYTFYRAKPFVSANIIDPTIPIGPSGIYWAYAITPGGCSDTIKVTVLHQNCPDLDEDDDGITDYVELNNPVALQDADSDGTPNWADTDYPSWVDNNVDGLNDNFDPGADSDNDGVANFSDSDWPGYTDANGDHVNDNMDADRDGIPDYLDLDSDNDGIPDAVESGGVDTNGDGVIDNFTDTDGDGLSQNVDALSGISGSGNGLGAVDLDGDGVPNYRDLDSDNDGIPDILEAGGIDSDNDGMTDNYNDNDLDGFSDAVDGDSDNNGIAENTANALMKTGADADSDGHADSYPNNNFDSDTRANPYDADSDNDGISDCREAGFIDADSNGFSDGTKGADGWDDAIDLLPALVLPNSDASGNKDYLDIDSDDDGIPDNVEGMSTSGYQFPVYSDTDGDGLDNRYDNIAGFGGGGITPNDQDLDGTPDYRDSDTDNDGVDDIIEGNDYNLNQLPDDLVTLMGTDADNDGLDDRFDSHNSSQKGTSAYMGTLGSATGDPVPGSNTRLQQSSVSASDRDWRTMSYVLAANSLSLSAGSGDRYITLRWLVTSSQVVDHFEIEHSADGTNFETAAAIAARGGDQLNAVYDYKDVSAERTDYGFYRIRQVMKLNSTRLYSNVVKVVFTGAENQQVGILPNPFENYIECNIDLKAVDNINIDIHDQNGRVIRREQVMGKPGQNKIVIGNLSGLSRGIYIAEISADGKVIRKKMVKK